MKVLSLHEPWATLVRLGIKTLETRTWVPPEKLIGERIAIASTQRKPTWGVIGDYRVEPWYEDVRHVEGCYCDTLEIAPECARRSKGRPVLTQDERVVADLTPGVIGCTVVLGDPLPIIGADQCEWHSEHPRGVGPCAHAAIDGQVIVHTPDQPIHLTVLCEQPYGDFTPGRFAWPLLDLEPVDPPVPFRGGQRLTREWEPE